TSPTRLPAAGASFPTVRHQRTWLPFPVFWSGDLAIRPRRDTTNAGSSSKTFQSWPPRTDAWSNVDELPENAALAITQALQATFPRARRSLNHPAAPARAAALNHVITFRTAAAAEHGAEKNQAESC